jgi:glutamyl/glutaminyl-tRNA synthetase
MSQATVVTRFAPSPTGALHVGGARTALFNWAYARGRKGRFLLRLEDTDRARSTEAAAAGILEDLRWLGLDWDNDPPPRQSQRLDLYNEHIERLLRAGRAYEDDGAVRFRMPGHDITVRDQILGDVIISAGQLEDFIIRKSDGYPTYHFAVVVDDAEMGITHVIRGQEHLNNTPRHVALQEALGFAFPTYAHLPVIMNMDGSKMSKRDKAKAARAAALQRDEGELARLVGDPELGAFLRKESDSPAVATQIAAVLGVHLPEIEVADFRASGYLPQVLCNYLALLGWNPGGDVEKFDNEFLARHFDFDRVGKSNSRFDREKLFRFNADGIKALPAEEFVQRWRDYCTHYRTDFLANLDGAVFAKLATAYQERSRTFAEPCELAGFLVRGDESVPYDEKAVDKNLVKGEGLALLRELAERLAQLDEHGFGMRAHDLIKQMAEERGLGMGKIAQPLRVAISGSTVTPPIDATLDILGKQRTLNRIRRCLNLFASAANR